MGGTRQICHMEEYQFMQIQECRLCPQGGDHRSFLFKNGLYIVTSFQKALCEMEGKRVASHGATYHTLPHPGDQGQR